MHHRCSNGPNEYLCRPPIVVCRPPIVVWTLPGAIISIYAAQSADSLVIFCSCRRDAEKRRSAPRKAPPVSGQGGPVAIKRALFHT
jgi:hypothetical protein